MYFQQTSGVNVNQNLSTPDLSSSKFLGLWILLKYCFNDPHIIIISSIGLRSDDSDAVADQLTLFSSKNVFNQFTSMFRVINQTCAA